MTGVLGEPAQLRLRIDGSELAALGQIANVIGIGSRLGEKPIGHLEDFYEMAVPGSQPQFLVEPDDAVAHIVERDAQDRLLLAEFGGALLDLLFQTLGGLGALGQQRIALDRVLPECFDRPTHCRDLVAARSRNQGFAAAAGDREHRAAQQVQTPHDIAADIEPDDQHRAYEAKHEQRADRAGAQSLNV